MSAGHIAQFADTVTAFGQDLTPQAAELIGGDLHRLADGLRLLEGRELGHNEADYEQLRIQVGDTFFAMRNGPVNARALKADITDALQLLDGLLAATDPDRY